MKIKMKLIFKPSKKRKQIKLRFFNTSKFPKRSKAEWKLIDRNPFGDADKDRVPNFFDCKPLNRKKQGKFSNKPYLSEDIIREEITPVMKSFGSTSIKKLKDKQNVSAFIIPSGDIVEIGTDNHKDFIEGGWQEKTKSVRLKLPKYSYDINVSAKEFTPEQMETIKELAADKKINYDIDDEKSAKDHKWGLGKDFEEFKKEIQQED